MRRLATTLATLAALAALACATATPARSSPEDELRALDALWARMYATHDTAAAGQLYDAGLEFVSANGRTKTKLQEMDDVRAQPGLVMNYFRSTPTVVRVSGDSGFVAGAAAWRFTMNGQPRDVLRAYEMMYLRGGPLGWRIVRVRMGTVP